MDIKRKRFNEWLMGSLVIGGLEIIWALSIVGKGGTLGKLLESYGVDVFFVGAMLMCGVCCVFGSIWCARAIRMWGLSVTPFVMIPVASLMMSEGIYNTITFSLLFIAFISCVVFTKESAKKPRNEVVLNAKLAR